MVKFNTKSGSPFSISSPQSFLSEKSIDRRTKHNVVVYEEDLPILQAHLDSLYDFKIESKSKWFNLAVISTTDSLLAAELTKHLFVDTVFYIGVKSGTNKKESDNWDYGLADFQTDLVNGKFLHRKGFTGKDILIGVIDVGFSNVDVLTDFEDMISEGRLVGTYDFVEDEIDVFDDPSHGASVLSTISAFQDSVMVGSAPHANVLLLASEDASQENLIEEFHYIEALEYADSCGADIVNTSLGYSDFDTKELSHTKGELTGDSTWISKATNIGASKGILMVTSSGNEGGGSWRNLTFPADADSALTVGAVDRDGVTATFSSVGLPELHKTIKPNVVAQGKQAYLVLDNGIHVNSNGTSFSSPQIAGWAACLMQAFPEEPCWRIKKAIEFSSHQYNLPDSIQGFGIPNLEKAYYFLKYDGLKKEERVYLDLFPNPVQDRLTIVSNDVVENLTVFDAKGAFVKSEIIEQKIGDIDLSDLSKGVYVIKFTTTDKMIIQKIVKY